MSITRTIHLDLGNADPHGCFSFHRGLKSYPVLSHTPSSRAEAISADTRLAEIPSASLTHYVSGVETDTTDGIIIQMVKQTVSVDGPHGPNTQTFDQLVSYSFDIPGSNLPILGNTALAYALMFVHNNLLSLDASNNCSIPNFILTNCVIPNAQDLINQLNLLSFQGISWISSPVTVKDVSGENLLNNGLWVYSQNLNKDALCPALPDCIGQAIKAAKNAPELQGILWNVLDAVMSDTYSASQSYTKSTPFPEDSGDVNWTVSDLTPGHGLSVDVSSLVVNMQQDVETNGTYSYAGRLSFNCTNHWLRHLGAYVQFLKYENQSGKDVLVPIDVGNSNASVTDPNDPNITWLANAVWPGDYVNRNNYELQGFGFIEPSNAKKYLGLIGPTGTISGIPVPATPTTLTVRYMPTEANVVRILWGGMGRGPYDGQVCGPGIAFTATFEFALPIFLAVYGAATFDSNSLEVFWKDKVAMFSLLQTIWSVVQSPDIAKKTEMEQDGEALGQFFAETLFPYILKSSLGERILANIGESTAIKALPVLNVIFEVYSLLITASQLGQTIVEVADSPFVFKTDIVRTFNLALTINPDADMHEFPPEAIGGSYQVTVSFSTGATSAVVEFDMPPTTWSTPIEVNFSNLPAGGQIQINVFMYSKDGWQAGLGSSPWLDAKGSGVAPNPSCLQTSVTVTNNDPPLGSFSVYQFIEKTIFINAARVWQGVDSQPPASQPVATRQTQTGITELNGLTLCQDAGMLGYTYQTEVNQYTVQNLSLLQNPQSAYAALQGLTVMPALAYQRNCLSDGSGLNFYLDTNSAQAETLGELRRLSLVWSPNNGSEPPDLNPQPGESFGEFPIAMDRLVAYKQYVAGISFDYEKHAKIYLVNLPDQAAPIGTAPKAYMISGPGTRVGLIEQAKAITFGLQGQILVLEQGNAQTQGPRVQAFDVKGNSYRCFDPTQSGLKQAVMPLTQATATTVFLDLAVEPKGYIYVLSYENLGESAADYHLDLYTPDGVFLARTENFAAARIAVDIIRNVYTLNYEQLENLASPEPSISLWIPPVKPNTCP